MKIDGLLQQVLKKKQTSRGKISLKPENRAFQTREYFGQSIPDGNGTYVDRNYQRSEKPHFKSKNFGPATSKDGWDVKGVDKDMREIQQEGYRPLANSRALTKQQKELGPVSRGFKAMVTPILDVLRPSRKQNVIGNKRPVGNASGKWNVSNNVVWNPADRAKTTIKEQTEKTLYIKQGGSKYNSGYATAKQYTVPQNRDNTTKPYIGNSSAAAGAQNTRIYNTEYNANLNPNKHYLVKSIDLIREQINYSLESKMSPIFEIESSRPAQLHGNFTKVTAQKSAVGVVSGRNY